MQIKMMCRCVNAGGVSFRICTSVHLHICTSSIYSRMHSRDFFYDNYKGHPESVLKRIAGDYAKLTPEAQQALRDVLTERNMTEQLGTLDAADAKKKSLAHLSSDEVRALVNKRLDNGENIESIKIDLRDKGVNIIHLSTKEHEKEELIDERFIALQKEGKSKAEIDEHLRKEFNLSEKQSREIPEKLRSNGSWLIVVGAVLLMICGPLLAVDLQKNDGKNMRLPLAGCIAGVVLLAGGLRKRMQAAKFIRENSRQ